jgi:hexokinase
MRRFDSDEEQTSFDWMAEKIETALAEAPPQKVDNMDSFPMGLAWSFPVEYVHLPLLDNQC